MIRQTRQRLAIEQTLRDAGRPLTAPEIHALAQKILPRLGLRTVYRQIKDMVDEFQLVGIDYPGQPMRYELSHGEHHPHFICRRCQKVFDLKVPVPDIEIQAPRGFLVDGQETVFFGLCPDCRN